MTISSDGICVIGDTHGHLQLGLCTAARWQRELGVAFEAVFLAGDIGSFTEDSQLDSATRRHAKTNPCELEFLYQWAVDPQPPWLEPIFLPQESGGLGLTCPVVMVHGNHEGFAHLETLFPRSLPAEPVEINQLPTVDPGDWIRYLLSGWKCRTRSGRVVAGVGGIEAGQRAAKYHPLAYLDERAIGALLGSSPVDVLVTHQGPAQVQFGHGSPSLDPLLECGLARHWFHGHSTPQLDISTVGRSSVVPLCDIAFSSRGAATGDPGDHGWSYLKFGTNEVVRERPAFWREYRRRKWTEVPGGQLVCPDLAKFI
jgi:hypothetical protein